MVLSCVFFRNYCRYTYVLKCVLVRVVMSGTVHDVAIFTLPHVASEERKTSKAL